MNGYDQQLKELLAQCARKRKLEASAAELRRQRDTYAARAGGAERGHAGGAGGCGPAGGPEPGRLFYNVVGKIDEKLTQERQEAYAARVRYDAAARELAGAGGGSGPVSGGAGRPKRLRGAVRRAAPREDPGGQGRRRRRGEQILRLEEREAYLESQERELGEASAAGQSALATADEILESLSSAGGLGNLGPDRRRAHRRPGQAQQAG